MALYERDDTQTSYIGPVVVALVLGAILLMLAVGWIGTSESPNPEARTPTPIPSSPPASPPTTPSNPPRN